MTDLLEKAPETDKTSTRFILDTLKTNAVEEELILIQQQEIPSKEPTLESIDTHKEDMDFFARERLTLPQGKKYFRISEVSELLNIEPHVLRYWQSEFKNELNASKTASGHWVYPIKSVRIFEQIKYLLYVEKFSIKGAKKKLKEKKHSVQWQSVQPQFLKNLNTHLKELIKLIKNDPGIS